MNPKQKQAEGPEYLLTVASLYKETEQEYRTLVILQTVREFAAFRYELSVLEEVNEGAIRYRVTGLKAPHLSLPGSGSAFFRREYRSLRGPFRIEVEGLDRNTNAFEFEIGEKQVRLTHSPTKSFVAVSTDPVHSTDTP